MNNTPTRKQKLFFWLILAVFSVWFAEVVAGSDMFPYFHFWGLFVTMPLYGLHTLFFAYLIFRHGRPNLYTLFLAGALFGLYEAYITKVLWQPTWGDSMLSIAGVALPELIVLALFWHVWLAFIIPLTAVETLLIRSRDTLAGLPVWVRQKAGRFRWLALLAVAAGLFQSDNSPSALHSLASGTLTTAVLLLLVYLWRYKTSGAQYALRDLLPDRNEFRVIAGLLGGIYLIMGLFLRREALPGLLPQAIIWLVYALLIVLFVAHLRRSRRQPPPVSPGEPAPVPWKKLISLAGLFTLASILGELLIGAQGGIILLWWAIGIMLGLFLLARAIKQLLRQPGSDGEQQVLVQT